MKDLCRYDGIKSVDFWGYDLNGSGFIDIYMKINDKYPTVYMVGGSDSSENGDNPNIEVSAMGSNDPEDSYRDPAFYMIKGHSTFREVKIHYETGRWKGKKATS